METLIKNPATKKEISKKATTKKEPKKRIMGHAKGKIWESPDCWNDDFDDEKS